MRKGTQVVLGLAAMIAIGASAKADFVAYNDFVTEYSGDANVTQFGTVTSTGGAPQVSAAQALKDYASGVNVAATMQITNINGNPTGTGPTAEFTAGTDAANVFGGKVRNTGQVIWYGSAGAWSVELAFGNLNPSASYTFAGTLDRGNATYDNKRWTAISILGADSATNASSAGVYEIDPLKVSIDAYNTNRGYIAKWTDINPGADGNFTVRYTYATPSEIPAAYVAGSSAGYGYGPSGIMLQESAVPEPTSLALLAVGGLLLGRRRA